MKKILIMALCTVFLTACQSRQDNYSMAYNENVLELYNNGVETAKLSGKDTSWEKTLDISRDNVKVYYDGMYHDGYGNPYGNESCIEPIYLHVDNEVYYVYENEDGIMFFCCLNLNTGEAEGLYAEEISDNDKVYDIRKEGDEVSFKHTIYHDGEPYDNIIKTTKGSGYVSIEYSQSNS